MSFPFDAGMPLKAVKTYQIKTSYSIAGITQNLTVHF